MFKIRLWVKEPYPKTPCDFICKAHYSWPGSVAFEIEKNKFIVYPYTNILHYEYEILDE